MKRGKLLHFAGIFILFLLMIGLTTCKNEDFDAIFKLIDAPVFLHRLSDNGLEAGYKEITGLDPEKYYKVVVDADDEDEAETWYVKSDGTLSEDMKDIGLPTGEKITGLTNGITYKVNAAKPFDANTASNAVRYFDHTDGKAPTSLSTVKTSSSINNGTLSLPLGPLSPLPDAEMWGINLNLYIDKTYEIMKFSSLKSGFKWNEWANSHYSGLHVPGSADTYKRNIDGKELDDSELGIRQYNKYTSDVEAAKYVDPYWLNGMSIIYAPVVTNTTTFLIIEYDDETKKPGDTLDAFQFLTVEVEP